MSTAVDTAFSFFTSEPEGNSNYVNLYRWYDWDKDGIFSRTLTFKNSDALLLTSGLTIITGMAAGRSWHIWRTLWHAYLGWKNSKSDPPLQSRKEQQLILRNSDTSLGAFPSILTRVWGNRKNKNNDGKTSGTSGTDYFLVIFIFFHFAVFLASSLVVSQLNYGNTVKSENFPGCGFWRLPKGQEAGFSQEDVQRTYLELAVNSTISAETYARSCYTQGGQHNVLQCNKFLLPSLPYNVTSNTSCPFTAQDGVCRGGRDSAITMETEYIYLNQIGINTRYGKSMSFKRRTSCAVINSDIFRVPLDPEFDVGSDATAATYSFWAEDGRNHTMTFTSNNKFNKRYELDAISRSWNGSDTPNIVRALWPERANESDVSLILLENSAVAYEKPIDDPFFSANQQFQPRFGSRGPNDPVQYAADHFLNVIGCTEQKQFCSNYTNRCTQWMGLLSDPEGDENTDLLVGDALSKLKPGSQEYEEARLDVLAPLRIFSFVLNETSIAGSIKYRGADAALEASRYLRDGVQTWLRQEQWKYELNFWWIVGLAKFQVSVYDTVDVPPHVDTDRVKNWADETGQEGLKVLCGRLKFKSPDHTSFSENGIIILVAFVGAFICISGIIWLVQEYPLSMYKGRRFIREWYLDQFMLLPGDIQEPESWKKDQSSEISLESNYPYRDTKQTLRTNTTEAATHMGANDAGASLLGN